MKLRSALKISRIFMYKGEKYFASVYPKEEFWTKKKFSVFANQWPMPDKNYEFSSEINVKPVIRSNKQRG